MFADPGVLTGRGGESRKVKGKRRRRNLQAGFPREKKHVANRGEGREDRRAQQWLSLPPRGWRLLWCLPHRRLPDPAAPPAPGLPHLSFLTSLQRGRDCRPGWPLRVCAPGLLCRFFFSQWWCVMSLPARTSCGSQAWVNTLRARRSQNLPNRLTQTLGRRWEAGKWATP